MRTGSRLFIDAIFGLQFVLSLAAYAIVAAKLSGWFDQLDWYDAMFLATRAARVPTSRSGLSGARRCCTDHAGAFSAGAAYGDLATAAVAILTLVALERRWAVAIALAWLVNVVGVFDLANALPQIEAVPHFNAAWHVPTFVVPLLLVTHAMMLIRLVRASAPRQDTLAHRGLIGTQTPSRKR